MDTQVVSENCNHILSHYPSVENGKQLFDYRTCLLCGAKIKIDK